MLKISIQNDATTTSLKLEGKLIGPWVEELDRAWRAYEPSLEAKKLCLDLREMTFADKDGIRILRKIVARTDAGILADTPLTRHFAAEACGEVPKTDWKEIYHA